MGKILRLNREKEAIEKALQALKSLPVEQIVVAAKFSDRSEEVFFYGNPKEIIQLLALAQFQIGFRYPLGVWDQEKGRGSRVTWYRDLPMLELRALLAGAGPGGRLGDGLQGGGLSRLPSVRRNDAGRWGGIVKSP